MRPNAEGGYTLEGAAEIDAARWAVRNYMPIAADEYVALSNQKWDNEAVHYMMPLGITASSYVLDALQQANAVHGLPRACRLPARDMLISAGRIEPKLRDRFRRMGAGLVRYIVQDD
jgi:hypothetical protein